MQRSQRRYLSCRFLLHIQAYNSVGSSRGVSIATIVIFWIRSVPACWIIHKLFRSGSWKQLRVTYLNKPEVHGAFIPRKILQWTLLFLMIKRPHSSQINLASTSDLRPDWFQNAGGCPHACNMHVWCLGQIIVWENMPHSHVDISQSARSTPAALLEELDQQEVMPEHTRCSRKVIQDLHGLILQVWSPNHAEGAIKMPYTLWKTHIGVCSRS